MTGCFNEPLTIKMYEHKNININLNFLYSQSFVDLSHLLFPSNKLVMLIAIKKKNYSHMYICPIMYNGWYT